MKLYLRPGVLVGFILAFGIMGGLGIYSYVSIQRLINMASLLSHSMRVIRVADLVLISSIDMETGQRGFVITGNEAYLQPYDSALRVVNNNVEQLLAITADYPEQGRRVERLKELVERRAAHVSLTVEARRRSFHEAEALINSGEGKEIMDLLRASIREIRGAEGRLFNQENTISGNTLQQFQFSFIGLLVISAILILVLFYSINKHIGNREAAALKLRNAGQEISQLNTELESFSYSVSHDLRAPLRSIDGYAQILKEDYGSSLDQEGTRLISVITANARRMGQLIDDLLDFSRLGRKEISKSSLNVTTLVNELSTELNRENGSAKAEIRILPLEPVKADGSMLRQVWFNLISNALKYSGKSTQPKIEIGSYSDVREVCYYVRDNGVGFSMEYVTKLFGVFQRLHKSHEFEGTGVGLALVKRIVIRHGGRVWAEGKINEGATFYFSLPK